jgi:hypothetical protein
MTKKPGGSHHAEPLLYYTHNKRARRKETGPGTGKQAGGGKMLMPEPCAAAVLSDLKGMWTFLQGDAARALFISLTILRALIYLLLKDPRPEARELACTVVALTAILLVIAIQEAHPMARSESVAWCADSLIRIATKAGTATPGG